MFEKLFLFCKGYLILKLSSFSKERFLNLCKANKIEIIDIVEINKIFYCKMACGDFLKIKPMVRKTGCRPEIMKKEGWPFLLRKAKKKKGLFFGGLLGLFLLGQCTGRIWHIDVKGGFLHTREQIVQVLKEELDVYGGIGRETVDCAEVERELRLLYNEISWVSVEKKGCNLYIRLNESTMPGRNVKTEEPCHIIAEKDGTVQGVEVISGIAQVKKGDKVKKGDILISGVVPVVGDYEEILMLKPVGACGTVWIQTDFSYQAAYPMEYEVKSETNVKKGVGFFWFQKKLFSYIPRYSEGKYDIIISDMVPFVFKDFQVPFRIRKYVIRAYVPVKVKMTREEAERKATEMYHTFLYDWETQGIHIIEEQFSVEAGQFFCTAKAEGIVRGNFISYREISEEEWQPENEYNRDNP